MSALQEAEQAIDNFVAENVSCASCKFWEKELIGGVCDGYEIKLGYMADDTSMCEQHEFRDKELETRLEKLQDIYLNE